MGIVRVMRLGIAKTPAALRSEAESDGRWDYREERFRHSGG